MSTHLEMSGKLNFFLELQHPIFAFHSGPNFFLQKDENKLKSHSPTPIFHGSFRAITYKETVSPSIHLHIWCPSLFTLKELIYAFSVNTANECDRWDSLEIFFM